MIQTNKESAHKEQEVDFAAVRNEFPVLQRRLNDQPLVYLDNAASSQMPQSVIDRINRYHSGEHSNVHRGIHTLSQEATDAYEDARSKVQTFINAPRKEEVLYTSGTTEAINVVAYGLAGSYLKEGDEIILSEMEHHANIVPWQLIRERTGINLRVIPINDEGELSWTDFEELINEKTALVAVSHVSNALGTINPVKDIVDKAHSHDIPVLIDGAQAVPHQPVDVKEIGCDFYAFSAHKMFGPTGIGILYGKQKWLEQMTPYKGGGEMIDKVTFEETTYDGLPHKFEAGTPPIAAGIGLGAAVDYLQKIGMNNVQNYEKELLDYGTDKLQSVDGLHIIGTAKRKASVLSFVIDDIHAHDVGTLLNEQGIAVRTGHHCAQPVMDRFDIPATARASLAMYNSKEDIDRLVRGLEKVKDIFS